MREKIIEGKRNGMAVLLLVIVGYVVGVALIVAGGTLLDASVAEGMPLLVVGIAIAALLWIALLGLKVVKPQEALVLTLFGKYYGTIRSEGFYFVNPFCTAVNPAANTHLEQSGDAKSADKGSALLAIVGTGNQSGSDHAGKKVSLKVMTLNNSRQKINDLMGNPIEIGIAVTWRVVDTAKAVFEVDNYKEYLSLQADAALRNIVRLYPYDLVPESDSACDSAADEESLRGSSELVAQRIRDEIQLKVNAAGLEIIEARITYLAYAPEIAAAMLQRQQASAIVDARKIIVDGAVGMVEEALSLLSEKQVVDLDEERKAAMVSNLLVVLCGNHDAQPIVNSGSLY